MSCENWKISIESPESSLNHSLKERLLPWSRIERIFFSTVQIYKTPLSIIFQRKTNILQLVCLYAETGYLAEIQSLTKTDYLKLTDDHDCYNSTFYFMDQNHHSQERAICSLFCDIITCHWIMMLSPLSICPDVSMHSVIRPQSLW